MLPPFDLFKQEQDGRVQWLGAMPDADTANAKAQELMKECPGAYFVYSQTTGNKLYVKSQNADQASQ